MNACMFLSWSLNRPGAWNQKSEGPIQVVQVPQAEMPNPPQVERLRERPATAMESLPEAENGLETSRSLAEVMRWEVSHRCMIADTEVSHHCMFADTEVSHRCMIADTEVSHSCMIADTIMVLL